MITLSVLSFMLCSLAAFSGSKAARTAKPAAIHHRIVDTEGQSMSR